MYVILTYDIGEDRVGKARKIARRFLPRVQNSVFEGEITEAKLEALKLALRRMMKEGEDSVLIWKLRDERWVEREVVGREKLPIDNFL